MSGPRLLFLQVPLRRRGEGKCRVWGVEPSQPETCPLVARLCHPTRSEEVRGAWLECRVEACPASASSQTPCPYPLETPSPLGWGGVLRGPIATGSEWSKCRAPRVPCRQTCDGCEPRSVGPECARVGAVDECQ